MNATDDQELNLIDIAETGMEAEVFFRTKLGKNLLNRADQERTDWLTKLIAADPEDSKLQRAIRNELKVIDMFLEWTAEAVNSGHYAHEELRRQDVESVNY